MKWLIVAIAFVGDVPINSKIFTLDPAEVQTAERCQKDADDLIARGKERGVEIWAACLEVKRDVKPQSHPGGEPGTEQRT